jgi:hypothetical protein
LKVADTSWHALLVIAKLFHPYKHPICKKGEVSGP